MDLPQQHKRRGFPAAGPDLLQSVRSSTASAICDFKEESI